MLKAEVKKNAYQTGVGWNSILHGLLILNEGNRWKRGTYEAKESKKKVISFATQNKFYSTKFVLGHTFYNHISCSVITATFTNL